ncbi:hypothetical protein VOLCADRAFT_97014 [Volvox carteri f. nagariensis]|uniref:Uncharacterized protein n=1 Tax=Volvox carteri f. nagariensis TaxID=3068 RepID=D8UBN7_VOLCA|nr:uncharacterized protein VOLCADRAFT_97014 [Volvox carteri f. nagariensis]EFJ42855.1 hypothetical protein VOLCADRAFT_97014 [Volvox carteri f. nagariensis]|eukprot:XP_002956115.1 hypothetical protein VOLCADRAFT_97014 [Volvox carteri f. nagariensis]
MVKSINVRSLTGWSAKLEVERDGDTVADLRRKVTALNPQLSRFKIFCRGATVTDSTPLSSLELGPHDFLISEPSELLAFSADQPVPYAGEGLITLLPGYASRPNRTPTKPRAPFPPLERPPQTPFAPLLQGQEQGQEQQGQRQGQGQPGTPPGRVPAAAAAPPPCGSHGPQYPAGHSVHPHPHRDRDRDRDRGLTGEGGAGYLGVDRSPGATGKPQEVLQPLQPQPQPSGRGHQTSAARAGTRRPQRGVTAAPPLLHDDLFAELKAELEAAPLPRTGRAGPAAAEAEPGVAGVAAADGSFGRGDGERGGDRNNGDDNGNGALARRCYAVEVPERPQRQRQRQRQRRSLSEARDETREGRTPKRKRRDMPTDVVPAPAAQHAEQEAPAAAAAAVAVAARLPGVPDTTTGGPCVGGGSGGSRHRPKVSYPRSGPQFDRAVADCVLPLPPALERLERIFECLNPLYTFLLGQQVQMTWHNMREALQRQLPHLQVALGDILLAADLVPEVLLLVTRVGATRRTGAAAAPASAAGGSTSGAIYDDGGGGGGGGRVHHTLLAAQGWRQDCLADRAVQLDKQLTEPTTAEPSAGQEDGGSGTTTVYGSGVVTVELIDPGSAHAPCRFVCVCGALRIPPHIPAVVLEAGRRLRFATNVLTRRQAAFRRGLVSVAAESTSAAWDPISRRTWHPVFRGELLRRRDAFSEQQLRSAAARVRVRRALLAGASAGTAGGGGSGGGGDDGGGFGPRAGAAPRPPSLLKQYEPCTATNPLTSLELLNHLQELPWYQGQVVHVEVIPGRPAATAPPAAPLSPPVLRGLQSLGIPGGRLYTHQADAVDALLGGKSLCYLVPMLQAMCDDPDTCALLMFPTKALAQDQLRVIRELVEAAFGGLTGAGVPAVEVYDGDTPMSERTDIRLRAQVILTNPDMLHVTLLPSHRQFARLLAKLAVVVVDEGHAYSGVFGCHTAMVLRRLRRLCSCVYGSDPRFVVTSATVANPLQMAARLVGVSEDDVALVGPERNGSPCALRRFVLWNPPLTARAVRAAAATAATRGNGLMSRTEARAAGRITRKAERARQRKLLQEARAARARASQLAAERLAGGGGVGGNIEVKEEEVRQRQVGPLWDAVRQEAGRRRKRKPVPLPRSPPGEGRSRGGKQRPWVAEAAAGDVAAVAAQARAALSAAADVNSSGGGGGGGGGRRLPQLPSLATSPASRLAATAAPPGAPAAAPPPPPSRPVIVRTSGLSAAAAALGLQPPAAAAAAAADSAVVRQLLAQLPGPEWKEHHGAAGTPLEQQRESPIVEVALLLAECVQHGLRTIAFCKSRKLCELVTAYTREILAACAPEYTERVKVYRAGYSPSERRAMEADLHSGRLLALAATNALELGVDVGGLDVTLHLGFPGSVASLWQQAGRAGRRERDSVSVLVAFDGPLDQHLVRHPEQLFGRPVESVQVDVNQPDVLQQHLLCAALEHPLLLQQDLPLFGHNMPLAVQQLISNCLLSSRLPPPLHPHAPRRLEDHYHPDLPLQPPGCSAPLVYCGPHDQPAAAVSLRAIDPERFVIWDEGSGVALEEIEASTAFYQVRSHLALCHVILHTFSNCPSARAAMAHRHLERVVRCTIIVQVYDGAVYLFQGRPYLCRQLNLGERVALVRRADVKYYTKIRDFTDVHVTGGRVAYPASSAAAPLQHAAGLLPLQPPAGPSAAATTSTSAAVAAATAATPPTPTAPTTARCESAVVAVRYLGFHRVWQGGSNRVFDSVDLFLPDVVYDTQMFIFLHLLHLAAYVRVPPSARRECAARALSFREGCHGANHALLNVAPLFLTANMRDLATECDNPYDARYRIERLLLYDKHRGGIGLSAAAAPLFPALLARAHQLVSECRCPYAKGCPQCVQHLECRNYNAVLSKAGAEVVLRHVLEQERAAGVVAAVGERRGQPAAA